MRQSLFTSATFRLTAWYMALLLCVSLVFSAVLYSVASNEFRYGLRAVDGRPGPGRLFRDDDDARALREARLAELQTNLAGRLVIFNAAVLAAGGLGSYLLARRTLRPIEEALESQSRFSSDAAHELRTPLTVVSSEIEVALRSKKASKDMYESVLRSNLDEVGRLQTLTDRLLMLAGNDSLELCTVELEDVAIETINRVVSLAQTKHITVENKVGKHSVIANASALQDVLTILVDNAIKYSPKHSTITVRAINHDNLVTIEVADEGPGIKPEERQKIFERFYRIDASRSRLHVQGYGLGLSIAKRLTEEQHGEIRVRSNTPRGSVFSVVLRRAQ